MEIKLLTGLILLLICFSCDSTLPLEKENITGTWIATKVNSASLQMNGFDSVILEIKESDSLELVTSINNGQFIFTIREPWKINGNFSCQLKDQWIDSKLKVFKDKLIFDTMAFFVYADIETMEFERKH